MSKLSAQQESDLDAALAELRDHIVNPSKVKATIAATPAGVAPPWLSIILGLAGPLIQQLAPILTQLLVKWLGGLTPPVTPPTGGGPNIPNLP